MLHLLTSPFDPMHRTGRGSGLTQTPISCSTSFEDIEHTRSIIQIASIPMSQSWCSTSFEDTECTGSITHWCSTSFEDIDYTGSITQIQSIPMSPVWCSTSFEDIDYTQGPSSKLLQFLCLNFRVLPLLKTLNTQGP